jgi:hypothetical protein
MRGAGAKAAAVNETRYHENMKLIGRFLRLDSTPKFKKIAVKLTANKGSEDNKGLEHFRRLSVVDSGSKSTL